MNEQDNGEKIVVALNKQLEPGRAINAATHAMLGLAAASGGSGDLAERLRIVDYRTVDANGFLASAMPLIVLRAKPGHLKRLLADLRSDEQQVVAFHSAMTEGNWREQMARSAEHSIADLELYAVATVGKPEVIDPLTKRCSLY
ncbi:MAG TPA: DUF2000 family protein [Solirubrobacterales bacterium]|nr:DUF2000 family protein [Solirubrobacterales bacterium]